MMEVMTVLGAVAVQDLGHTQVHEHLLLDSNVPTFMGDLDKTLNHPEVAVQELAAYWDSGGRTLVEVTTPDFGRDPLGLVRIARESKVHIVMGMGLYREPYYPEWVDYVSTDQLTAYFIDEIDFGVGETGIYPGIIGEIGSHRAWTSAKEERVFRAAGRAQRERGLALMTHTPPGAAIEHLALLRAEGANLEKVAIGHADTWLDADYHRTILEEGAYLSFDHIGMSVYPDDWRAEHLADLVKAGHASKILLSTDIYTRGRLRAWGGAGYSALIESFLPRLLARGVDEADIRRMTVENPAHFLGTLTARVKKAAARSSTSGYFPDNVPRWALTRPLASPSEKFSSALGSRT